MPIIIVAFLAIWLSITACASPVADHPPAILDPVVLAIRSLGAPEGIARVTKLAAELEGLDPYLVAAVITAESQWRAGAHSKCHAHGYMQLCVAAAAEVGVDRFDPVENIIGGCRYLAKQINRFGEVCGLAAFNAGPGRVARAHGVPDIPETRAYIRRVLRIREGLRCSQKAYAQDASSRTMGPFAARGVWS